MIPDLLLAKMSGCPKASPFSPHLRFCAGTWLVLPSVFYGVRESLPFSANLTILSYTYTFSETLRLLVPRTSKRTQTCGVGAVVFVLRFLILGPDCRFSRSPGHTIAVKFFHHVCLQHPTGQRMSCHALDAVRMMHGSDFHVRGLHCVRARMFPQDVFVILICRAEPLFPESLSLYTERRGWPGHLCVFPHRVFQQRVDTGSKHTAGQTYRQAEQQTNRQAVD